jgi:hypothetical protein
MERENKMIKTSGGHEIVLKSYLTGREVNKLKEIVYSKINYQGQGEDITQNINLPGSMVLEQELAALEVCVVSIDGITDGVSDAIQDLKASEYQEIVNAVNEVTKDLFPQPKSE